MQPRELFSQRAGRRRQPPFIVSQKPLLSVVYNYASFSFCCFHLLVVEAFVYICSLWTHIEVSYEMLRSHSRFTEKTNSRRTLFIAWWRSTSRRFDLLRTHRFTVFPLIGFAPAILLPIVAKKIRNFTTVKSSRHVTTEAHFAS